MDSFNNEIYLKKLYDICNTNNIVMLKNNIEYHKINELLNKCYEQQSILTYTFSIDINSLNTSVKLNINELQNYFNELTDKLLKLHDLIDFITNLMKNNEFIDYYNTLKITTTHITTDISTETPIDNELINLSYNSPDIPPNQIDIDDLMILQSLLDTESNSSDQFTIQKKNKKHRKYDRLYLEEYSN